MKDTKVALETAAGLGEIKGNRKWYARILAVGHGSSAVHTQEAMESTGASAWPIGTKIYINHQGWESLMEFPSGDLNSLAGVITSTPEFIDNEDPGLYAAVEFSEKWGPFVEEFKDFIGLSIRSAFYGEEIDEGSGLPIVEGYVPSKLNTVDLVSVPGAKGRLLSAIESYVEKHGKINDEPNTSRKDGQEVTPEEIQEAINKALEAAIPQIVEALTPEVPESEETDETVEVVSEAIATANLPESARKRVYGSVREGVAVSDAIEAEKAYIKDISETLQMAQESGRISGTDTDIDFSTEGWN